MDQRGNNSTVLFRFLLSRYFVLVLFLLSQAGCHEAYSQCGHASSDFQDALVDVLSRSTIKLATTTIATTENIDASRMSLTPLRGAVVNGQILQGSSTDSPNYGAQIEGCVEVGETMRTVVKRNYNETCRAEHMLNSTMRSRIYGLTTLVLRHLESLIAVDYVAAAKPILILDSSYHACPVSPDFQYWDFGSPVTNMGVVITALPFPAGWWSNVLFWALPCAWDSRNRPVLIQLNVNPIAFNSITNDDALMQSIRHHLLHALGFGLWSPTIPFGFETPGRTLAGSPSGPSPFLSSWTPGLGRYAPYWSSGTWAGTTVTCATRSVPMDEELRLANLTQFPQFSSPASVRHVSHFEPRVVQRDAMGGGVEQFSWRLSSLTASLINSRFTQTGLYVMNSAANTSSLSAAALAADPPLQPYLKWMRSSTPTTANDTVLVQRLLPPTTVISGDVGESADCTLIDMKCSDLDKKLRRKRFCFPSPLYSTRPTGACTGDRLGVLDCASSLSSVEGNIPIYMEYAARGAYAEPDYCPLLTDQVSATQRMCIAPVEDVPFRGSTFASDSRCFESNITLRGPRPGDVPATRCLKARCPLGVRVEFQLNGSATWTACNTSGIEGTLNIESYDNRMIGHVACPSVEDLCGENVSSPLGSQNPSSPPWSPQLDATTAFTRLKGTSLEFRLINEAPQFTRSQATRVCRQLSASVAFIPDAVAAQQLAATVFDDLGAAVAAAWIGPASQSQWDSFGTQRYSTSYLSIPVSSTGCYVLNLTAARLATTGNAVVVLSAPCDQMLPVLCTRPFSTSLVLPKCPLGTRCTPTSSLLDPTKHRAYFVPAASSEEALPQLLTAAAAATACTSVGGMYAKPFDLDNLTSVGPPLTIPSVMSPWYQTMFSVLSVLAPDVPVWTGLRWRVSDPLPPWSLLVQNWPVAPYASGAIDFCFLLVSPDTSYRTLFATPDCLAMFAAVCYSQNPALPVRFPGSTVEFFLNHVPLEYSRVSSACPVASSDAFLSPVTSKWIFHQILGWLSSVNAASPLRWLGFNTSVLSLWVGADFNASSLTVSFAYATQSAALVPNNNLFGPFNVAALLSPSHINANVLYPVYVNGSNRNFTAANASSLSAAYVCARPINQTAASWSTNIPTCANASLYCNGFNGSDSTFALPVRPVDFDSGFELCSRSGAMPVFQPSGAATDSSSSYHLNSTLFTLNAMYRNVALAEGQLFWTGLMVTATGTLVVQNSSTTLAATYDELQHSPGMRQYWTADDASQLTNGTCVAAHLVTVTQTLVRESQSTFWWLNTTTIRLVPMSCRQPLLFPCKKPKATGFNFSDWITPEVVSPNAATIMPFFSGSASNTSLGFWDARSACAGQGADLAWVPNGVDFSSIPVKTQAWSNFITHASLPSAWTKAWVGFSTSSPSLPSSRSVHNGFGVGSTAVLESRTSECFSLLRSTLEITSEPNCNAQLPFLCMRQRLRMSVAVSQPYVFANVSNSFTVTLPPLGSIAPTLTLPSLQSGATFTFNASYPLNSIDENSKLQLVVSGSKLRPESSSASIPLMVYTFACTKSSSVREPVRVEVVAVPLQSCCGIHPTMVASAGAVDVYPCVTLEFSATSNASFTNTFPSRTVFDLNAGAPTIYVRMPSMPGGLRMTFSIQFVSDAAGDNVLPTQLVSTNQYDVTFVRSADSVASSVEAIALSPRGAGGVLGVRWTLQSCNVSPVCPIGAAGHAGTILLIASTLLSWNPSLSSTPTRDVWGSIPLALTIFMPSVPLLATGGVGATVSLQSSCPQVRFAPRMFIVAAGAVDGSASRNLGSVTVLSSAAGTCDVTAVLSLSGGGGQVQTNLFFSPSNTSSNITFGHITFRDSSAIIVTFDPPFLTAYPGENITLNVKRKATSPSFQWNSLAVSVSGTPSSLAVLPSPPVGLSLPVLTLPIEAETIASMNISVLPTAASVSTALQGVLNSSFLSTVTATYSLQLLSTSGGGSLASAPRLQIIIKSPLVIKSLPTLVTTGTASEQSSVVLWLPQTPVESTQVTATCNFTQQFEFSNSVVFTRADRAADHSVGVRKSLSLVPPDSLTDDARLPFQSTWSCRFQVAGSPDVATALPSFSVVVIKRGRGTVEFVTSVIRPNRTYFFNVSVQAAKLLNRSVSVVNSNFTANGTNISLTTIQQTTLTSSSDPNATVTQCLLRLHVPLGAATSAPIALAIQLNDTLWFRSPNPRLLELAPLVEITALPLPEGFLYAQPVGSQNAQTLQLRLSTLPRDGPVTIACNTTPANTAEGPIASFSPQDLTIFPTTTAVTNATLTTVEVQITGLIPNIIFYTQCTAVSSRGELFAASGTTAVVQMVGLKPMQFLPLLAVTIHMPDFPGILFVDRPNMRSLIARISTLPAQNVTVSLSAESGTVGSTPRVDPSNCVAFLPSNTVTFSSLGNADLVVQLTVVAACDSSVTSLPSSAAVVMSNYANITVKGTVITAPSNFDNSAEAQARLRLSFPVLPRRKVVVVDPATDQTVTTVTVFCGGEATTRVLWINVTALPLDPLATATVRLFLATSGTSDDLTSSNTSIYANPASLQFSASLTTSKTRVWELTCPRAYFTGALENSTSDDRQAFLSVEAPTEFDVDEQRFTLKLLKLLSAVVELPTEITVGSRTTSLIVSPEALPMAGQPLELEFVSTCPESIRLQHSNVMTWVAGMADSQQALRVVTSAAVQDCVVAVQLLSSSVARNYLPVLFEGTVSIYAQSSIVWLRSPSNVSLRNEVGYLPRVTSKELGAPGGVTLYVGVDQSNRFIDDIVYPTPLDGVYGFDNATEFVQLVATLPNQSFSMLYLVSNVPNSATLGGIMTAVRRQPTAITCSRSAAFDNVLEIHIEAAGLVPSQDELLTLVFTERVLVRADAALSPTGTALRLYVAASNDELSDTRDTTIATAVIASAVTALFAGPILATRSVHISSIVDMLPCPSANWKSQKQRAIPTVLNPIPLIIGTGEDDLGRYFAGAVYGLMLLLAFMFLHAVAMFLIYARRLEMQIKMDSSTGVAMAMLRFPSLEVFPAMYLVGVVAHFGLKVIVYSSSNFYRGISALLVFVICVCIPAGIAFLMTRTVPIVFQATDRVNSSVLDKLFRAQGVWVTDPRVLSIAHEELRRSWQRYIAKYGMLFEDFVGPAQSRQSLVATMSRLTSQKHRLYHHEILSAALIADDEQRLHAIEHEGSRQTPEISGLSSIRAKFSRFYYLFDVVHSIAVAAVTVYEPIDNEGCLVQSWILAAVLLVPAFVVGVLRPFRHHTMSALVVCMSVLETLAALTKAEFILSSSTNVEWTRYATNVCLLGVASLMFLVAVLHVGSFVLWIIQYAARNGYSGGSAFAQWVISFAADDGDGNGSKYQRVVVLDNDVPMKELLQDFVPSDVIAATERAEAEEQAALRNYSPHTRFARRASVLSRHSVDVDL